MLFLWLLLVAAAGLAFSQSTLFTVRTVRVTGLDRVSRDEVLAAAGVTVPANVFTLDPRAIQVRLSDYPPVASAKVVRRFPAGLRIDVVERRAVGALPYGQHFLLFDGAGVPFAVRQAQDAAGLPVVTGCRPSPVRLGKPAGGADLRWVAEVLQNLPDALRPVVTGIEVARGLRLTLVLADGVRVFLGAPEETGRKLGLLPAILSGAESNRWNVKEIDLSNPERPFLRRKDVAVQPPSARDRGVGVR